MKKLKWVIITGLFLCLLSPILSAQADSESNIESSKTESTRPDKFPDLQDKQQAQNDLYTRMITATVLVIVLGTAAIVLSKKVLPKLSSAQGKHIRLIETVHIAPRKSVHLIEVGDQKILIGSTCEQITRLAEIAPSSILSPDKETTNS